MITFVVLQAVALILQLGFQFGWKAAFIGCNAVGFIAACIMWIKEAP